MKALPVAAVVAVAVAALVVALQQQSRAKEPRPYRPALAQLEQSIDLPSGQGTVHVLRVPTGYMESTRCVVATSPNGGPAVSCTPKDFDIPADDSR